jgi:very-short-patch-repair endonuclease
MSAPETSQKGICASRIKQVFEYLKALNDHRNPAVRQVKDHPWHFWLDHLPDHPDIELRSVRLQDGTDTDEDEESKTPPFLFRVRRPKLTPPPPLPLELHDWLYAGWDDPENQANFHVARIQTDRAGETITVRFDDNRARPAAFALWQQKHEKWRQAELPARQAMAVFEKLYALHGKLERESESFDLVIADGLLSWQRPEGSIFHPVLIQRVQLEFNSKIPEFQIVDGDVGCELYTTLFQTITEVDPAMLAARRQELEDGGYHPLSQDASAFLHGFVNHISAQGIFLDHGRPEQESEQPVVARSPLLFLRSRTKGYGNAIEQVLRSIESRDDFCDALINIVGCETPRPLEESTAKRILRERDVLFGKEANQEQFRIAQQLETHGSVLVQGRPGTGKSHTIANLIGHLLANGQSVLVTSHTTKALRVLREHVVENLRPLCVSVLESDLESREQLKQSVLKIASRLNQSNVQELEGQAEILNRRRSELLDALERSREDLRKARADEYRQILIGGTPFSPSDAARKVADGRGQHDWIPGPLALGETLPLSPNEIKELYTTNASTCSEDDRLASWALPPPAFVLSPEEFFLALEAKKYNIDNKLWQNLGALNGKEAEIQELLQRFREVIAEFNRLDLWQLAAVEAGRDPGTRRPWDELLRTIEKSRRLVADAQADFIKHRPETASEPSLEEQFKMAKEIREHLLGGGELTERRPFFGRAIRKSWRLAYEAWSVNARPPETAEEVTAIWRLIAIKFHRTKLATLWNGLMAPNGALQLADFREEPESGAAQFTSAISESLNWWNERWSPLLGKLADLGFNWSQFLAQQPPNIGKHGELIRCVSAAESHIFNELEEIVDRVRMFEAEKKLEIAQKRLEPFERPNVVNLRRAMLSQDPANYRLAHKDCVEAAERQVTVLRRRELLERLKRRTSSGMAMAEEWAGSIQSRTGIHGKPEMPGDPAEAWNWRQLNDELDRRAKVDLGQLGGRIDSIQDDLRRTTNELIDQKAWAAQVRRTSQPQRKALMGWLDTIKRIGKGTGKRAPQLRREAQHLMEECQSAVPVWVMSLARLVESFDYGKQCFDVVIIDEASQCDVMALLALALAKKVVIVGDDEQVSPLAVGQKQEAVNHLINVHLQGIPLKHLYDGLLSIYDLAKQSFESLISLLEHFRCVPDIIQFSNYLCYRGDIKPLREETSSPIRPHLVPFGVEGVCDSRVNVNREEAWTVASLLAAALERPEYRDMTFGVISLLGNDQAYEIEQLLLKHLAPEEYQRRRIICGNSAQFQGDERDVMFLSMVWSPEEDSLLTFLDRKEFRQRFNVAASRAKNQMWLIYSLDPTINLKPGDLRRKLIEHVLDPGAVSRELKQTLHRTQSHFERLVLGHLIRAGYRVRPQWPVGNYRIDFVVEGGGQRLALECDGDRYHPLEKLPEDMERQAILERMGWRFMRVRGSTFFRDPESTMKGVFKKLEEMEIPPEGPGESQPSDEGSIVSDLKRRASEIRVDWQKKSKAENRTLVGASQQESQENDNGKFGDKEIRKKENPEVSATSRPAAQATLFPPEEEPSMPPRQESIIDFPRLAKGPNIEIANEVKTPSKSGGNQKNSIGTPPIHRLLLHLDKAIFPGVVGTERQGSRRARIARWQSALGSCNGSPEELFTALAACDLAIARGKEASKVKDAIKSWLAENQR